MPHILNANLCPAIQRVTGFLGIAASMTAANAAVAESDADTDFATAIINPHARRLDDIFNLGGANVCCILGGSNGDNELSLSVPGSGLLLPVLKGKANCGGEVELAADASFAVPDNTSRVWIWLLQTGTLTYTVTTAAPTGGIPAVLLGSCVTSGGNITAVDTSGVMYLRGDRLERYSNDPGVPVDSPPAGVRFTQVTAFGEFRWNGSAYIQQGVPFVTADPSSVVNGMEWFRTDQLKRYVRSGGNTYSVTYS